MLTDKFDIIIAGSGMAGLSLVYRALKDGTWGKEKILIIDKEYKNNNDRTWCFWQKEFDASPFDTAVYHSWKDLSFFTNAGKHIKLENGEYVYKMIRSIDFYKLILSFLRNCEQVTFVNENIITIKEAENSAVVVCATKNFVAKYVFNSTYNKPRLKPKDQYFLQHFKGIRIRTKQFKGNPSDMHFMDFRTSQTPGTTFFYVLPLSQEEIFLEYTIFSKALLNDVEYDLKIDEYLKLKMKINEYEIIEKEFGVIPMTDYRFKRKAGNVMNIGTSGGDTRASSGYTFNNVQKTISKILAIYKDEGHPFFNIENISFKHRLLDSTMLNVLDNNKYLGHEIFTDIFENVAGKTVMAFLDSESTTWDDIKVMNSLKARYFIKPFFKALL